VVGYQLRPKRPWPPTSHSRLPNRLALRPGHTDGAAFLRFRRRHPRPAGAPGGRYRARSPCRFPRPHRRRRWPRRPSLRHASRNVQARQGNRDPIAERLRRHRWRKPPRSSRPRPQANRCALEARSVSEKYRRARKPKRKAAAAQRKPSSTSVSAAMLRRIFAESRFRRAVVLLNQAGKRGGGSTRGTLLADPAHAPPGRPTSRFCSSSSAWMQQSACERDARRESRPAHLTGLRWRGFLRSSATMPRRSRSWTGRAQRGRTRLPGAARTVLQRMGPPGSIEAYQAAVQGGVQPGATWVGLGSR